MNPLEQRVAELERKLESMTNAAQIDVQIALAVARNIKMGDIGNVDDTGITNGQLLKWNSTTKLYEPADDNTA